MILSKFSSYLNRKTVAFGVVGITVLTFGFEHYARQNNIPYKPSAGLIRTSKFCSDVFTAIGTYLARISSFYSLIDLREFRETALALIMPTAGICTSPLNIVRGYCVQATTYVGGRTLTVIGTMTLVGGACLAFRYYQNGNINLNILNLNMFKRFEKE